jgi:non-heme chloroperoxidase
MKSARLGSVLLCLALVLAGSARAEQADRTAHKIQFVTTSDGVRLEVVDWGGTGPALVFLAGFGNTAHSFDGFAPHFISNHHVYGITRRGFGASASVPVTLENYDPDRLADDVLDVMTTLKIERPVLIGHSIAGQELSSIATRYPGRVNGLVYLDAAMHYAFYDPSTVNPFGDAAEAIRDLKDLRVSGQQGALAASERLKDALAKLQVWVPAYQDFLRQAPAPYWSLTQRPDWGIENAMMLSERRYKSVSVPFLAISAIPCDGTCDDGKAAKAQAGYVASTNPSGKVIQLVNADHNIWLSNGPEVERQINGFLAGRDGYAP